MDKEGCNKTGGGSKEKLMVKFELEAAEALAGLAHSAVLEQEQLELELEQPTQRLKHRDSSSSSPHNSMTPRPFACDRDCDPDPSLEERVIAIQERSEEVSNVITKAVKDEKNDGLKPGVLCSSSYASVAGSKSRRPLTEIEKETRRIRRVLANRESARQTIRRRQAMFEDLTRKSTDLAVENENLKREKELAVKEYDSLKSTNDCLKEQIAKMVKPKAEEIPRESSAIHAECSASASAPSSFPLSPYNQPLHWASMFQPLDATLSQSRSLCETANPSLFPATHTWRPELFSNQRDSIMIPNPGTLLYVLPFPCFFSLSSPTNALHPQSSNQNDRQNKTYSNNQCTASSSSKNNVKGEDCLPSLSLKVEIDASNSRLSIPADDVHQVEFGVPPDKGGCNREETYPNRIVLMPTPSSCVRPPTKAGAGLDPTQQNNTSTNVEAVASASEKTANGASEDYQEPVAYRSKRPVDASTAAENRRRRKELMKLKILQACHH
ncbi:hypothetical protein ACH5RR_004597 [Cinchona calisaya]|uniref:BZIP domain-containing protein n=1 Tax=Cinchona calisaya TaxID=153742 RepID=A0ABD3AYG4_9GENT